MSQSKSSKRMRKLHEQRSAGNLPVAEAVVAVKANASAKFDETVELALRLGVDPRKSEQMVRGVAAMPSGTGKTVRIAVVCQGDNIAVAEEAGADIAGFEDLLDTISKGKFPFDVLIAEPTTMSRLSQYGKLLGPKGLMPNPKSGTVTNDIAATVTRAKAGQVTYRTEKSGIVHAPIGLASFTEEQLVANFNALIASVKKSKPAATKGQYLVAASLSSTMGPSVHVDITELR